MNGLAVFLYTLGALILIGGLVAQANSMWPRRIPTGLSVADITKRVARENASHARRSLTIQEEPCPSPTP
ncbi:hypothetical protein IU433_14225 [Nocardia puris]|uniref:hypothetical protein n=1 Tax=Nocardia puris TaxID=208602 RepID=UPI0018934598|nr:hypothetical protein [Nocardia puris]MBF6460194.1 hypothetical protein [Nocardia puris]